MLCAIRETCPLEHVSTICHSSAISYAKTFGKKWLSRAGKPFPNSRRGLPSLYLQRTLHPPIFAYIICNNNLYPNGQNNYLHDVPALHCPELMYVLISQETQVWCIFRKNARNFYRIIANFIKIKWRGKEKKTDANNIFQEGLYLVFQSHKKLAMSF